MIEQLRKRLLDREHPVRIHLIGVAGAGMSGLARMLLEMGHAVSGCDRVSSRETERLQEAGLRFSCPHNPDAIKDADVVIYSSAIREDNPALKAAREKGCLCLRRAECLAAILNSKKGVVVAGTHGKTTTSSLTAHLLREGRLRPCHYVGAEIPVLGANAHWTEDSEYLIAEGWTSPKRLAIDGGSNGGLLVGACLTQRPDLYGAAVPEVGVLDMLRYHRFTIGWAWASDYGTSDDSREMFEYLKAYSPLHNLYRGMNYPPTLVMTADHDDRVVPAHSFKFAATLQEVNDGPNPTLIRIDSNAGHGAGRPIGKIIDSQTDMWSFVMYHLGMKPVFE